MMVYTAPALKNRATLFISRRQVNDNFNIFLLDKPANLKFAVVVKNKGVGLGINLLADMATQYGASYLVCACLEEALLIKNKSLPILILGERSTNELAEIAQHEMHIQVQSFKMANNFARVCAKYNKLAKVHFKIDSGLGRYGVRWDKAALEFDKINPIKNLQIMGLMTHFAMSDEKDKSYANLQWQRFKEALAHIKKPKNSLMHACNTGGYLDLPAYHCDMCRIGVLFSGNYPSASCRRIKVGENELSSAFTLKSKLSFIKKLKIGDYLGYGMHYQASKDMLIGVIPLGYGDGFPRLRNKGHALINGQRVAILGGVAMDCMMIDLTNAPKANLEDEVVLMGQQGNLSINPYDMGRQANTVVYDILTGWQTRLNIEYF
ncbi:MAG: alanine racemase [SAR324 cluster bacterium]|nr:alanine racemase [SAR324 cluster bacterium]